MATIFEELGLPPEDGPVKTTQPAAPLATSAPTTAPSSNIFEELGLPPEEGLPGIKPAPVAPASSPTTFGGMASAFGKGAETGAKEAIVPFSMTAEERTKSLAHPENKADEYSALAGYLLGNIGTGITAGAAAGSFLPGLGTAVGAGVGTAKALATVGPALYAVYSGLGRDRLRSQQEGETWNPLSGKGLAAAALTVGTELNPLIKVASKPAAIIRAAAQPLAEMGIEKLHGGNKSDIAIAGVAGLIGGVAVARNVAGKGDASKKLVGDAAVAVAESLEDPSRQLMPKVREALKSADLALPKDIHSIPSLFKREIIGDVKANIPIEALDEKYIEAARKLQPSKLEDVYAMHVTQELMHKIISDDTKAMQLTRAGASRIKDVGAIETWTNPMLYVARNVDKVTGLQTMKLYDMMQQNKHAYATIEHKYAKDLFSIRKAADKLGISGEQAFDLIEGTSNAAIDKARRVHGDEAVNVLKERIVAHTDGLFKVLEEHGMAPTRRMDYMPHATKSGPELALAVDDLTKQIGNTPISKIRSAVASWDGEGIAPKGAEQLKLLDALAERRIDKKIDNFGDIENLKSHILSAKSPSAEGVDMEKLSALFSRKGTMADVIQEKNAWELLSGYVGGNIRAAVYDDTLRYGQMMIRGLDDSGMPKASQLFKDYMSESMGGKFGLDAVLKNVATKMEYEGTKRARDVSSNLFEKTYGKTIAAAPEFMQWANNLIYPGKLALNIPGTLRNFTQFLFTTVPEVGSAYGSKHAFKGALEMMKEAGINPKGYKERLIKLNLLSEHFTGDQGNVVATGSKIRHGIDTVNEFAMNFYGASDATNRIITYNMGQSIAKDLLQNNKDAIKFLNKMDVTAKAQIKEAMKKGGNAAENIGDVMGRYLIAKTQFDFGRAAQSKAQRAVGPLFNMFTTWPVQMGASVVNDFRERGAIKGAKEVARKYGAGYAMLAAASAYLEANGNPLMQYLVGRPEEYSPISAIMPAAPGSGKSLISNPIAGAALDVAGSVGQGDFKGAARAVVKHGATSYIPLVSPIINEANKASRHLGGETLLDKINAKLGIGKN